MKKSRFPKSACVCVCLCVCVSVCPVSYTHLPGLKLRELLKEAILNDSDQYFVHDGKVSMKVKCRFLPNCPVSSIILADVHGLDIFTSLQ